MSKDLRSKELKQRHKKEFKLDYMLSSIRYSLDKAHYPLREAYLNEVAKVL